jgi:hypothetical protein
MLTSLGFRQHYQCAPERFEITKIVANYPCALATTGGSSSRRRCSTSHVSGYTIPNKPTLILRRVAASRSKRSIINR